MVNRSALQKVLLISFPLASTSLPRLATSLRPPMKLMTRMITINGNGGDDGGQRQPDLLLAEHLDDYHLPHPITSLKTSKDQKL